MIQGQQRLLWIPIQTVGPFEEDLIQDDDEEENGNDDFDDKVGDSNFRCGAMF